MKDADTVFVLSAVEAAVPSHRFTFDKPVTDPDVSNFCMWKSSNSLSGHFAVSVCGC